MRVIATALLPPFKVQIISVEWDTVEVTNLDGSNLQVFPRWAIKDAWKAEDRIDDAPEWECDDVLPEMSCPTCRAAAEAIDNPDIDHLSPEHYKMNGGY